jgi:hypothetical protein
MAGPFYPSVISTDGYENPDNAKAEGGGVASYSGAAADGREIHASGFGNIVPTGQRLKQITLGVNVTSVTSSGTTSPAVDAVRLEAGGQQIGDAELHGWGLGVDRYEPTISGLDISADDANDSGFGLGFIFYDAMSEPDGTLSISVDSLYIKEIVCE